MPGGVFEPLGVGVSVRGGSSVRGGEVGDLSLRGELGGEIPPGEVGRSSLGLGGR